ncbi:pyruvate:ferredoxin (flavodoxin) oxidoreductase [Thiobacillus sp.]|uniref:pyruvate:ferredoxin (flavodoxin) oxidoreductase n=1 Tax=Thiobacillus sp. TaxID=924 RepID=UPI0017FD26C2|nr:pyruvate:ferredoxin (flavodoxin) oxidoreductase [Thiobacillus sp.]MBC2730258.1 pyruvate:ferredoxin (flavodoxin) oxidoreductase [Thiobacillus sp.]MBC2738996.1 pyruvate:ferredoxin (flavodoxin) oxidoreductase [Thiobacillus sp.]MBC2760716.1 pyruvate:ferredoxin (flavodoxin) oxidoreductase [Thiobacillus sp.]
MTTTLTIDGNEAVARMAYLGNEVIAIYPITPASSMGEWADEWASQNRPNLWGAVPKIIEMQSEGGAAGALHGALTSGALATSFTASQGLLLMIPNLYKIAGELTPFVLHVAARTLATHALSIFGDQSDVMACRATGCAMLAANSPQEAQDFAVIAQAATLAGRIPVIHFFDGFRTSHEVAKIAAVDAETVRAMIDDSLVTAHRARALSPEHPVLRGTSQNPDVFFQSRERANPYYDAFPGIVQDAMDRFGELTGRRYTLFDYVGATDAERVIVLMGSGAETVHETVEHLVARGEKVGVLKVRLYRPFSPAALLEALPPTVTSIAVLDRCKEPGADGEPLYKDVLGALAQASADGQHSMPRVIGGRYGLASKEFTPGMVKAVFDELSQGVPKPHKGTSAFYGLTPVKGRMRQFTVGIHDDLTHLSLPWDTDFRTDASRQLQHAVFWGLGADGTVSANKNSIKILGEATDLQAQGYFVYDSKKSGAVTVSHLRFGPAPIRSTYLVEKGMAGFVACHQPMFIDRYELLEHAAPDGVFLLNTPASPEKVWGTLPENLRAQIQAKRLQLWVIDAYAVADEAGMGRRINTIMQTCFFAISGILPKDEAIAAIKQAVDKTYGKKSRRLVELNYRAIDMTLSRLYQVAIPAQRASSVVPGPLAETEMPVAYPDFARDLTLPIYHGHGDALPVSMLPADGTYPLGTAQYEKRNIALEIPVWEADLCTQCGKCVFVCPHSAIRARAFAAEAVKEAPPTFKHVPAKSKEFPAGTHISYQVAAEDCTGCGDCVEACPIHDKSNVSRRAVNMAPVAPLREQERDNFAFFLRLPEFDRAGVKHNTIPGAMLLDPLFEFSGACAGCGETPYIRLATQLFGDRMLVANATGCSSIYGGNLPSTPYTVNGAGRGPAWSNSLFEDNAEFGLGMRLAADQLMGYAQQLVRELATEIGGDLADALVTADQREEAEIVAQRQRVARLLEKLASSRHPRARQLASVAEWLIRRSVWIIGGDGWAYDIGYGGLDHVLALPYDVNILVLDTEVYSNTGGQTSKATPIGAVAKFSAGGKATAKKDLAKIASDYGHVYVATAAYGAKDVQTLRVFHEAESYTGPSLIVAYSPCIAHGYDMLYNQRQQELAVKSGHWPLFRFDPRLEAAGANPFKLDSAAPSQPVKAFMESETRFAMLQRSHPEAALHFLEQAQKEADRRYKTYQDMAQDHADESKPGA